MADVTTATSGDDAQLTASQSDALQQYMAVTDQDASQAIPLLRRSQWNVQIAIAKFFDGEGPDPVAEALAAQNEIPREAPRLENLQESLHNGAHRIRRPETEPAPRVVNPPTVTQRLPWVVGLLLTPFQLGQKLLRTIFRAFFLLFSFLPQALRPQGLANVLAKSTYGRRQLLPADAATRFRREFEEQYGQNHNLPFFEGGYAQAYDRAKRDVKFLLVVLISPEHDDTEAWVRETLMSPRVTEVLNDPANNMMLWAGNVHDSEAYQVFADFNCAKFPWSALVCLTPKEGPTRMGTVKRLVGPMSDTAYARELQAAMAKYGPDLEGVRAERRAQEQTRSLRTEQDTAYERSLAKDRERAKAKKQAELEAAAAEKRAAEDAEAEAEKAEKRREWRRWRATTIAPEPSASGTVAAGVVRLALKMPASKGGERVIRRFAGTTTVEELYAFVECYGVSTTDTAEEIEGPTAEPKGYVHEYQFRIASMMPRKVYDPKAATTTLAEEVGRSGNLIVEEFTDEDDDE